MAAQYSLESEFDCNSMSEDLRFSNLLGFKRFKHQDTGLKVNFANVEGSLYTIAVVVPTFLADNKGKAHTLEHLIFTGSEKYPQRGLLDKLATSCMSNGTNAYTSDDHTNYTFSTGSAHGLQKLLPVFLDHILHPRIIPETVDMEVFSLKVNESTDETPIKVSAQGVVYCEMKGRQFSEADLMDLNLRRELCDRFESEHPVLSRFKWECGGLTKDIATLSMEEIIAFHRCFYKPSNISIIICGKMSADLEVTLLSLIASVLKTSIAYENVASFTEEVSIANPRLTYSAKIVHFPANENTLGSAGFAWLGASAKDLIKVLSFHVLFKYLRETSSSPLYQSFVQIENPLATEIDYEIKPLCQTIMTLIFSGVPNNSDNESESNALCPGYIRALLKEVLVGISLDLDQFEKMIVYCLRSFELKLIELIEEDPYETILSYTIPSLISETINPGPEEDFGFNVSNLKVFILELKSKPTSYWIELLQELISIEPVEVIMIPDVKLNEQIDKQEVEYLTELYESGYARVSEIPEIAPYHIEGNFDLMSDSKMTPFRMNLEDSGLSVIELPGTGLKYIIRISNFKRVIPVDLWPYLVLYQELLFQCDVNLSGKSEIQKLLLNFDDKITYQMLQKTLNSMFNNYGINFGIENDTFSLGYCEEALSWTVALPSASKTTLRECLTVLETVATGSVFTPDRVKIVSENLYNQIQDLQKDPYEIIESILTLKLHEMHNENELSNSKKVKTCIEDYSSGQVFETCISMFKQKGLLKRISDGDSDVIEETLASLNEIKRLMHDTMIGASSFVQVGSKTNVVKSESSNLFDMETSVGISNFDLSDLPKFGRLAFNSSRGVAFAIGDITASYLSVVIPCNVLPSATGRASVEDLREYVSVSLICQLLSVTEGPIYSAIRGRGLAYDASLTVSLWNGLLTFAVNDSNDPCAAFNEFRSLMSKLDNEIIEKRTGGLISEDSLNVAKSAFLYQMIEETATPSSMFNACFKNRMRFIPMGSNELEADPVREMIKSVTCADLSVVWSRYFSGFLKEKASMAVLVVPKSVSSAVISKFEGVIDFELKTFKDFAPIEGDVSDSEDEESEDEDDENGCEDESEDGDSEDDESQDDSE